MVRLKTEPITREDHARTVSHRPNLPPTRLATEFQRTAPSLSVTWFAGLSGLGAILVIGCARWFRGRFYARFTAVLMILHLTSTLLLYPQLARFWPAVAYLQLTVILHLLSLSWARLRPWWWRALISIPGATFWAGAFLALPWAAAAALGFELPGVAVPFVFAGLGAVQSLSLKKEDVHLSLTPSTSDPSDLRRHPRGEKNAERPLRIVQITDPHLGPFMSPDRLARICQRAVDQNPDLIIITGDLLTMESHQDLEAVTRAFSPLAAMPGRTFACHGNHDHEARHTVEQALMRNGIQLLVDEATVVETDAGRVQILGMDFVWRYRAAHMAEVCQRHPRQPDCLRLILLHDPGAFTDLPEGQGDLVLSGHTHGGQLGLVSLGLPWTFLSLFPAIPDHGFWARGPDRLYVHRGTGHYGFPIRLGVPAEESVLYVHPARPGEQPA